MFCKTCNDKINKASSQFKDWLAGLIFLRVALMENAVFITLV